MDIYDLDMRPGLPEELERLKEENERLRKAHEHAIEDCKLLKVTREENERLRDELSACAQELNDEERDNERLRDELEEARYAGVTTATPSIVKDADRYRWLKAEYSSYGYDQRRPIVLDEYSEYWDSAIDAALRGEVE